MVIHTNAKSWVSTYQLCCCSQLKQQQTGRQLHWVRTSFVNGQKRCTRSAAQWTSRSGRASAGFERWKVVETLVEGRQRGRGDNSHLAANNREAAEVTTVSWSLLSLSGLVSPGSVTQWPRGYIQGTRETPERLCDNSKQQWWGLSGLVGPDTVMLTTRIHLPLLYASLPVTWQS